jgi:carbamoyl-phosphate synthase small subunit
MRHERQPPADRVRPVDHKRTKEHPPVFEPAILVLEDGTRYRGRAYGKRGTTFGEAVFATGMTGYQETLTDPSYAGQIVVQTAPQIGNTGVNQEDNESRAIWVAGYVVREPSRIVSNWRATGSLADELVRQGVVGISHIDTRALTRRIRDRGAMRAGIFSGADAAGDPDAQLAAVRAQPSMAGQNLSARVTTPEAYVVPAVGESHGPIAVIDLGIKRATLHRLAEQGFDVHVLPATATLDDIRAVDPVGVFFSNGPGDPAASDRVIEVLRQVLAERIPFFGICFGNQLLGRAWGSTRTSCRLGTAASTSRCSTGPPAVSRSPRRTTGSPCRRPPRASSTRPSASAASRSATSASTTRSSRGCAASTCPRSPCSTTRRRPPARTTPAICSAGSAT